MFEPGDRVLLEGTVINHDTPPLGAVTITIPEASADGLTDGVVLTVARAVVHRDPTDHAALGRVLAHESKWWLVEPPNEEDR